MEKGDTINFRDSFVYGIGDILSIYLYEQYDKKPKETLKILKDILLTYPYNGNISNFEKLDITSEKLLNSKILKRKIKNI